MTKNQLLPELEHYRRWEQWSPLAAQLSTVLSHRQLTELCDALQFWVDWDCGEEPQFDVGAPDGAEILTALLHQAQLYASREEPVKQPPIYVATP